MMIVVTPASFMRAITVVAMLAALAGSKRYVERAATSPPYSSCSCVVERVVARLVLVGLGLGLDPAEHALLALQRRVARELGRLADELLADELDEVRVGLLGRQARSATGTARSSR